VIVDLGTGDGRAVITRATGDPRALVIGIDAAAASMAESSRRADRRGPPNALFLAVGAAALVATPLAGQADVVTVTFPWGSLLRGVLGGDEASLRGIASIVRPGGRVEVLASVVPADRVAGFDRLDASIRPALAHAWFSVGLRLTEMRPATPGDVVATGSTWARRLGAARPVWRLAGVRSASIDP
jgi:16S rRNA (adenine(1408)-N(1))-methyltransferase